MLFLCTCSLIAVRIHFSSSSASSLLLSKLASNSGYLLLLALVSMLSRNSSSLLSKSQGVTALTRKALTGPGFPGYGP